MLTTHHPPSARTLINLHSDHGKAVKVTPHSSPAAVSTTGAGTGAGAGARAGAGAGAGAAPDDTASDSTSGVPCDDSQSDNVAGVIHQCATWVRTALTAGEATLSSAQQRELQRVFGSADEVRWMVQTAMTTVREASGAPWRVLHTGACCHRASTCDPPSDFSKRHSASWYSPLSRSVLLASPC